MSGRDARWNGGPAFPQPGGDQEPHLGCEGMSLRDYFAAHAPLMVPADATATSAAQWAACAGIDAPPVNQSQAEWSAFWNIVESRLRYIYADAMLAARAPKPEPAA